MTMNYLAKLGAFVGLILLPAVGVRAQTGSVIFIHPDGTGANSWGAALMLHAGPDGDLNWDRLPAIALYRGHMADSLVATSNGGATTHAFGIKVDSSAYGKTAAGKEGRFIRDAAGESTSVLKQAHRAGIRIGVVQSGTSTEPGTGCFLAEVDHRSNHDEIALQLVQSDADVIFGGGEGYFIPMNTTGVWGKSRRKDDKDLIAIARERGYTVVRTRDELLALPANTPKVLGLFANYHTFNDNSEEENRIAKLPDYNPDAPTIAEMTEVALRILGRDKGQFCLVVEEEGTDNFGNTNNARGMLTAMKRADDAIGVAIRFVDERPDTLVFTAADSDAGGMQVVGIVDTPGTKAPSTLPAWDDNGAPMDGIDGRATAPFTAAPDRNGRVMRFGITWAAQDDVAGGILVRGIGLNSHLIRGSFDNTKVAGLIRLTLFGSQQVPGKSEAKQATTAPTAPALYWMLPTTKPGAP